MKILQISCQEKDVPVFSVRTGITGHDGGGATRRLHFPGAKAHEKWCRKQQKGRPL